MPLDSEISFREDILRRLDEKNLTQEKFAKSCEVGKTTLNNILNGKTKLNHKYAKIFAKHLGLEESYFEKYINYEKKVNGENPQTIAQDFNKIKIEAMKMALGSGMVAIPVGSEVLYFSTDTDPAQIWKIVSGLKRAMGILDAGPQPGGSG